MEENPEQERTGEPVAAKPKQKRGLAHLAASTRYSLSGLGMALQETAVRHELILGALHFTALFFVPLDFTVKLLLSCLWFGILVVELLNTALEAVVDLASPGLHPLAKRAKDVASAAVFVALTGFGLAWGVAVLRLLCR